MGQFHDHSTLLLLGIEIVATLSMIMIMKILVSFVYFTNSCFGTCMQLEA